MVGGGIADEQGNVIGKFDSLKEADEARRNAKLTLQVQVPEAPLALKVEGDGSISQVSGGPLEEPVSTGATR
jgi:hypothetical protein